jgi:hypothetical protein
MKSLYPVIAMPPVLDGWLQVTMMLFSDPSTEVVGELGWPGTVAAMIENGSEYAPNPTSFLAATLNK